jgi:hypothetical protein
MAELPPPLPFVPVDKRKIRERQKERKKER